MNYYIITETNWTKLRDEILSLAESCHKAFGEANAILAGDGLLSAAFETLSKDMLLKLFKYQQAGVREYWIVDPKFNKVTVHYFDTEEYDPKQYSFKDVVPIEISGRKCNIDFTKI